MVTGRDENVFVFGRIRRFRKSFFEGSGILT
jgi:hypothetical protein